MSQKNRQFSTEGYITYAFQISRSTVIPTRSQYFQQHFHWVRGLVIQVKSEWTVKVGTYEVLTAAQMEALGF